MLTFEFTSINIIFIIHFIIIPILPTTEVTHVKPINYTDSDYNTVIVGVSLKSPNNTNAVGISNITYTTTTTFKPPIPLKCERLLIGQYPFLSN